MFPRRTRQGFTLFEFILVTASLFLLGFLTTPDPMRPPLWFSAVFALGAATVLGLGLLLVTVALQRGAAYLSEVLNPVKPWAQVPASGGTPRAGSTRGRSPHRPETPDPGASCRV